jgi:hypothetical protein
MLQSQIRGFFNRLNYKINQKDVLNKKLVEQLERDKNSIENKVLEKAKINYPPFDREGWKKFYNDREPLFNDPEYPGLDSLLTVDYGRVFNTILRIYYDSFYSGNINLVGKRHGYGDLFYHDGKKFQGHWINNEFMGWGRYNDLKGNLYEGSKYIYYLGCFIKGKLNGKGTKILAEGNNTYVGDFIDGIKEGNGIEETPDFIYRGMFKNDMKEGKGTLVYKNSGNEFEGDFSQNTINGFGYYVWQNKQTYNGTFLNGKMHGTGTYSWPDGGEYKGQYINNIKEGEGVFRWPNGRIYKGKFLDGNPHGIGVCIVGDKTTEVEFINGNINKNYKKSQSNNNSKNEGEVTKA